MRRGLLFFVFFLLTHTIIAQKALRDSLPLSLQEAWTKANSYSKELRIKQLELKNGEQKLKDARQDWLPEFNAEASYGKLSNIPIFVDGILKEPDYYPIDDHSVYDAGVSASINLYNGRKTRISVEEASTKQAVLSFLKDATISEVHYKVAEYYLNALRSLQFEKIIQHNIYESKNRLSQIRTRYKNGIVLKSDLLRAQLQLSRQQINFSKIKNDVAIVLQELNMIIGCDDDQPLKLTDRIEGDLADADSYDKYVKLVMQQSPFEQIAQKQIFLSKLDQRTIKVDRLPRISLFGNYTYSYPQTKLYPYSSAPYLIGEIGLRISYNISSLYRNKHKERAAALAVEQQKTARFNVEDRLRSRVKTAYLRMQEDMENLEVDKISIKQAVENYRIENQTYFNQMALLTDLLTADSQLMQARFDLVNDFISARLHYYQLLKLTGQL